MPNTILILNYTLMDTKRLHNITILNFKEQNNNGKFIEDKHIDLIN